MGKELSLAREEEEGRSVLLASTGIGELITTSIGRDKRTEESSDAKVSKGTKAKNTKTKSKGGSKVKGANASTSKRQRRRRGNKNREQGGGDEGKDRKVRRSASELGITFPGTYCDELKTVPHYWFEVDTIEGGSLFRCRFCRRYLWLPKFHLDSDRLSGMIRKYGGNEGYCRYLNMHRPAKLLIAKLQDLRRLEMEIADKREFARLTDKILSDGNYDRKRRQNDISDYGTRY